MSDIAYSVDIYTKDKSIGLDPKDLDDLNERWKFFSSFSLEAMDDDEAMDEVKMVVKNSVDLNDIVKVGDNYHILKDYGWIELELE